MAKRIYVGNLAFSVTESYIVQLFSRFGQLDSCTFISDRAAAQAGSFAFIQMRLNEDAVDAIEALNGKEVDGRNMVVVEAGPRYESKTKAVSTRKSRVIRVSFQA